MSRASYETGATPMSDPDIATEIEFAALPPLLEACAAFCAATPEAAPAAYDVLIQAARQLVTLHDADMFEDMPEEPYSLHDFHHRWPAAVALCEFVHGMLVFHSAADGFDERDVARAERVYPGRIVELDYTDGSLWVHPDDTVSWNLSLPEFDPEDIHARCTVCGKPAHWVSNPPNGYWCHDMIPARGTEHPADPKLQVKEEVDDHGVVRVIDVGPKFSPEFLKMAAAAWRDAEANEKEGS